MIAALNYDRLKQPDGSVEHWLLLNMQAFILKHWTWVLSQYQRPRRSLITAHQGTSLMDLGRLILRREWTTESLELKIWSFTSGFVAVWRCREWHHQRSERCRWIHRDYAGWVGLEGLRRWYGSSIDNMILLMEDILQWLNRSKSLDIHLLGTCWLVQDVHQQ